MWEGLAFPYPTSGILAAWARALLGQFGAWQPWGCRMDMERAAEPNRGLIKTGSFARWSENAQLCLLWKGKKVDPISTLWIADAVQCMECGPTAQVEDCCHCPCSGTLHRAHCEKPCGPSYAQEQKCICVCKISNSSTAWTVGRHLERQGWSWMQAGSIRKRTGSLFSGK